MLLGGNISKNDHVTYNESFACLLFYQCKYTELYQLLSNSKDSITKYYNIALCCFWAEDYDQAIINLDQAINKLSSPNRTHPRATSPILEKIQNKQKMTNDFISFLQETYVSTFPNETFDNCLRFKVECLKYLERWSNLLQVASLIENKKYHNVDLAIQQANKMIK